MCPSFMDKFIFWLITFWVSRVSQCPESLDTKKPEQCPALDGDSMLEVMPLFGLYRLALPQHWQTCQTPP